VIRVVRLHHFPQIKVTITKYLDKMNKTGVIKKIKKLSGFNNSEAITAINAVQEVLMNTLTNGEKIVIPGFGTFQIKITPKKMFKNPKTLQVSEIPEKKKVIFVPSKTFTKTLNEK